MQGEKNHLKFSLQTGLRANRRRMRAGGQRVGPHLTIVQAGPRNALKMRGSCRCEARARCASVPGGEASCVCTKRGAALLTHVVGAGEVEGARNWRRG